MKLFPVGIFLVSLVSLSWGQCVPGLNCKLPNCRCWFDNQLPGGFAAKDVPQIVLVSYQYAISSVNVDGYRKLLAALENPNGCPAKGTFFVQTINTDLSLVSQLATELQEIGITTADGTVPVDRQGWIDTFAAVKAELIGLGIDEAKLQGTRGPSLDVGGNDQFDSVTQNRLVYDSTCVTEEYTTPDSLLWPFTYDFIEETPRCTIGNAPTQKYPGKWQFTIPVLQLNGVKCAAPSGCSTVVTNQQDAFDLLYDAFAKHYEGGRRSPFVLYVDPLWLTKPYQEQGTRQFLEFIRTSFDDTWVVTHQQALAWIGNPVASVNISTFAPWKC